MKFILSTSQYFYYEEEKNKLEQLGFKFIEFNETDCFRDYRYEIDVSVNPEIEINTLEELMEFISKYGRIVVHGGLIEIYNGYRE